LNQLEAKNETLEKLQFPEKASVSPGFKFSAGKIKAAKNAISTLGSIVDK